MITDKARVRVAAGRRHIPVSLDAAEKPQMSAGYLRDTRSAVISTRVAPLTENRDEIRRSWRRVAGLAQDLVRNSGRLSGVLAQIVSDVIGTELQLVPVPDRDVLRKLGYDDAEVRDLVSLIKAEWKYYSWNPRECDLRGKRTVQQQLEIGLRDQIIYGEATGFIDWMPASQRARYGLKTGTKLCMMPPTFLVQDSVESSRMIQGVIHDENWRPVAYRFREEGNQAHQTRDWPAYDRLGNVKTIHVFEPTGARDVRGISPLAAALRKEIQHEMLEDMTLQMAVLQTALAISLTSEGPSQDAFEALSALKESNSANAGALADEFIGMYAASIQRAQNSKIHFGTDPVISHLAPGEKLDVRRVEAPGPQYEPFEKSLSRDFARAIGVTYESFTLDNRGATYSSSRVGIASIWPVVLRRRERGVAPIADASYANFLDEAIFYGRIPFKGGYEAFSANRDRILWAQWRGPAKPSADDKKSADASTKRIENYTSTVELESAELGHDVDELMRRQEEEHRFYLDRGMRSPYDRPNTPASSAKLEDDEDEAQGAVDQ